MCDHWASFDDNLAKRLENATRFRRSTQRSSYKEPHHSDVPALDFHPATPDRKGLLSHCISLSLIWSFPESTGEKHQILAACLCGNPCSATTLAGCFPPKSDRQGRRFG